MFDKHKIGEKSSENELQDKVQIKQSHAGDDNKLQAPPDPSPSLALLAMLTSSHTAYLFPHR